jgi:prolyl oligopeptidase
MHRTRISSVATSDGRFDDPAMTTPPVLRHLALLFVTSLAACRPGVAQEPAKPDTSAADAATALHQLFDDEWQRSLQENPTNASRLGDKRYNRLWPDQSVPAVKASQAAARTALERLHQIPIDKLSDRDQLWYRLFERQYETDIELQRYPLWLLPLNQREGIQDESTLGDLLQFDSAGDYEDWIARLDAFPAYMSRTIELLREGAREGMVHPRIVMRRLPAQIRKQIVEQPEQSLYFKPLRTFQVELPASQQDQFRAAAARAIELKVVPAYREFLRYFEEEYLPACFEDVGCWQRPDGEAMYAALARQFTTTSLTPDEIHEIGLQEVARIRAEMDAIQREVGFDGSFQEFLTHLRTDPQFYCSSAEELMEAYRACCRTVDPQLPKLFKNLPKTGYEIVPIPDQMAPDTTTAYYQPPTADGSRPGGYYVNLYRIETRPRYEIDALSLHEAVPGHHLQIALAMEQNDVPDFVRFGGQTAFIEGWALYTEKLGSELGLYRDPYSRFGQLTYEMWRAVRLVVDTGMHHKRWSRQQAIDFFAANTAKSLLDIENEIDRYITWPGQALAYKIGELKIRELRTRAEQQLGDHFDVRDFHDVVLRNGAVPLDVLEEQIDTWLER